MRRPFPISSASYGRPAIGLGAVAEPSNWVPWFAAVFVASWSLLGLSSSGQWGDHFEQFVWAHGVEWGYHKHPPLPTWLLVGTIWMFGPSTQWATGLGALCTLGTAFFTYRVALELLGSRLAVLSLMFWGLQQPFSNRAFLFNHNTVMMLGISATAWCLLMATKPSASRGWWIAVGLLAGASVLAKYQALVPLAGLLVGALRSGELGSRTARAGLLVATLLAIAVLVPHVAWVLQHHATTLSYAAQEGRVLSWIERVWNVTSFLAQQVRLAFPALVFAGLIMVPSRRTRPGALPEGDVASQRPRAWMFGLVAFPLGATLLTSPLLGLELQNHWGYQALQFAGLWLAWRVRALLPSRLGWPSLMVLSLLHATLISLAFSPGSPAKTRQDLPYPAQELADAVRRDWQDETSCPLVYVVGPTLEAGIVSVYNGGTAAVLEDGDGAKSPWIKPDDLQQRGAVYIADSPAALPTKDVTRTGYLDVAAIEPPPYNHVHWAIVAPPNCPNS